MNSLAYLSRQFDVLASPRAPPPTPVHDRSSFLSGHSSTSSENDESDDEPQLKRVRTWSAKSFLFPPQDIAVHDSSSRSTTPPPTPPPKRSLSSPALNFKRTSSLSSSSSVLKTEPVSVVSETISSSLEPVTSKLHITFKRLFIVRVFWTLWEAARDTWSWIIRWRITKDKKSGDEIVLIELSSSAASDDKEDLRRASASSASVSSLHKPPPPPLRAVHTDSVLTDPRSDRASRLVSPTASVITEPSRSSTPLTSVQPKGFRAPKTLVLDLDETLIHSTSRAISSSSSSGGGWLGFSGFGRKNQGSGHMIEVVLEGRSTLYHVYKRPFVDYFLRKVSGWYTLVIFTASMQEYADPVIDWLDAGRGILARRLFRESCTQLPNGQYSKDLSVIDPDLSRICLVDNSPVCCSINEANGIPIEGWTHDPSDEALLHLLPVLDSLRFTNDVRRVLGIRGFTSAATS